MAPAAHDSDSDASNVTLSPKRSKTQAESPEQQSDQTGPEESEEEDGEVYEIESILDAKRGATGSARIGYLVKWHGYPDEENSWVDEQDAVGAQELIKEFWARQKKKGDKMGRKSDPKPKGGTRRPVAISVENTPEPAQATKKRGRTRTRAVSDAGDEEEDTRSKKKGRKSNGTIRKASPSPASSSDRDSPAVELLEPSTIKKWRSLPSWEEHVETIDTVERIGNDDLLIYFKLKGEKTACKEHSHVCADKFPKKLLKFYETNLKWKEENSVYESD
ncbi:hypothetical protein F5888DRAFT_1743852 [Russula emetica]|nr:hypothetical protein F5888DRAFT_1743852 [Russula emetica]